ncbi:MAG: energy-coupling factor transporter transmembrane protein EcfT [Anaerolineae bacterium]|nr:energy-coupling factor transporter transmembrane protein EcfT [Anaerolineae bacterium]
MRFGRHRTHKPTLVAESPLRQVDPRAKLALSVCLSLAVMLPLERLVAFMLLYVLVLLWARLLPQVTRQVWQLKWLLVIVLIVDWLVVGLDLAIVITLRIVLLASLMVFLVGTTTSDEFRLALEALRVPYRYAFSLGLAFQSTYLLGDEWRSIQEAQMARGAWQVEKSSLRLLILRLRDLVALTVPAIVLTTRRAWAATEAACARGLDAPHRRSYKQLAMRWQDWGLIGSAVVAIVLFVFVRL